MARLARPGPDSARVTSPPAPAITAVPPSTRLPAPPAITPSSAPPSTAPTTLPTPTTRASAHHPAGPVTEQSDHGTPGPRHLRLSGQSGVQPDVHRPGRGADHRRRPGYGAQTATVEAWQRSGPCWEAAGGPWTGLIGANGFSDHHREGDGTTPTGLYGIGPVMYGNAPNPGVQEPYHQLVCGDWWDEDPALPPLQHLPARALRHATLIRR